MWWHFYCSPTNVYVLCLWGSDFLYMTRHGDRRRQLNYCYYCVPMEVTRTILFFETAYGPWISSTHILQLERYGKIICKHKFVPCWEVFTLVPV